jgi:hypothetical protein
VPSCVTGYNGKLLTSSGSIQNCYRSPSFSMDSLSFLSKELVAVTANVESNLTPSAVNSFILSVYLLLHRQ